METLNTIRNNIAIASTWEINWSPSTGRISWLTMGSDGFHVTAVEET